MSDYPSCYLCTHFHERPGSCHGFCDLLYDPKEALPVFEILGMLGGRSGLAPAVTKEPPSDMKVEVTHWPGCGNFPNFYDGNILRSCNKFEGKGGR